MHRLNRQELLRIWFLEHSDRVGLFGAMFVVVVIGVIGVVGTLFPLGPVQHMTATVTKLGHWESRSSSQPKAGVMVGDRLVWVNVPSGTVCAVGSRLHFTMQRRFWGDAINADWPPCDSARSI